MPTFIRRMLEGTAYLMAPDDGSGTAALDAGSQQDAGGDTGEPEAGSPSAEPGTAAEGTGETAAADPAAVSAEAPPAAQTPEQIAAQQRTNRLVAERWAERRRAEAAEQQSRLLQEQLNQTRQALQAQPQVDADGNPIQQQQQPQPVRQPPQDLQAMAAQIAAQNAFNDQVAAEVARGRDPARGGHADFDQVAANLQRFGELPRTFVEAALATGKGADVMYALGGDIAEADRILSMSPMHQAVALAQLAGTLKTPEPPKKVTSAAAPIVPKVGSGQGRNTPSLEDPNMPVGDWIKLREKEIAANKGAGNRRASR